MLGILAQPAVCDSFLHAPGHSRLPIPLWTQGMEAEEIVQGDTGMHSGGGGRALPSDALAGGVIVRRMTLTLAKLHTSHTS